MRHDLVLGAPLELSGRSEERKALTCLARRDLRKHLLLAIYRYFNCFPDGAYRAGRGAIIADH